MARGQHPRILVWGDSYAAAIAMGFKQLEEKHHFSVGWLSSSSCPPFMGFTMVLRPFCKENNDWIMDAIRKAPPDIVILHSTWSYDPGDIRRGFASTVSELRAVGIKKIIVMGPVATWNGAGLPTGFIEYSMRGSRSLMPKYSFFNSNYNANKATEALLQEQAALHGLTYVSPLSMMCNGQGCMARIGEHDEQLTSFDTGHVTVPTATFLVQALLPQILQ